jgi:hypothetical protein
MGQVERGSRGIEVGDVDHERRRNEGNREEVSVSKEVCERGKRESQLQSDFEDNEKKRTSSEHPLPPHSALRVLLCRRLSLLDLDVLPIPPPLLSQPLLLQVPLRNLRRTRRLRPRR